ncbi:MAG: recombinase family protein [Candidatus Eisenbacteria bacterium]
MIAPTLAPRALRRGLTTIESTVARKRTLRCAIYSRVSTDEQAALEYNSLQAQEEICSGYVAMRGRDPGADATWQVAETYRDAGYSGGTLERPALRRLMQDVDAGRIHVVVVYKIDRLSRSISQFYQVWNVFERKGVDLVSATQDLNTTTSQGKLMLNMLLSFGQFEREQIGERTRDKIGAARRRGKWTGGTPLLGLDVDPRGGRLLVNKDEASLVKEIFRLYLETPSLTKVVEELGRRGWHRKTWTRKNGFEREGAAFDKPGLLRLLRNPLYCGKVHHRGSLHPGEHPAIIEKATWERAQALLNRNGDTGGKDVRNKHGALLRGLLRCAACDSAMTHSFTRKGDVVYRYYVCITRLKKGAHACPDGKVSAHEVEQQVVERIRAIGSDPDLIAETVRQARAQLNERRGLLDAERRQLTMDSGRQKTAMKRLLGAASAGGTATSQVAEIEGRIEATDIRLAAIAQEIEAAKGLAIDDHDVSRALEAFGPVWDSLWPAERSRIITLLAEGITYDGRDESIAIRLRADGIRSISQSEPA